MELDSVVALALDFKFKLNLDPGPEAPDSGYVANAFLDFACACDLAGSEDGAPGFESASVYI